MELRLPLEVFPGREATCRAVFGTWGSFPDDARAGHCPFVLASFTGWSSERCPGIGFLPRGDREIGVLRNVEAPTRPRLECRRETGLNPRCDRKVGNPFQTKQGSRPSCRDQEGRRGSEEVVPENLVVPLQGDRDAGELCGAHQGCQVPFRPPIPNVGLDRKSTRLNSSHHSISYAVFCLKKKKKKSEDRLNETAVKTRLKQTWREEDA